MILNYFIRLKSLEKKGTNRSQFFRGEIDKYTWVGLGSSFLPSEISSAFLHAQLNACEYITSERLKLWNIYFDIFASVELSGYFPVPLSLPIRCIMRTCFMFCLIVPITRNCLYKKCAIMAYIAPFTIYRYILLPRVLLSPPTAMTLISQLQTLYPHISLDCLCGLVSI